MDYEFISDEQKRFFDEHKDIVDEGKDYAALVYTLGLHPTTRDSFDILYNANRREIKPGALLNGYWSSGERAVIRLAFLLFTYNPVHGDEVEEYTPLALLSSVDGNIKVGMLQAMKYFA